MTNYAQRISMLILAVTAYFSATASKFEQDGIFYVILSEIDKTVEVVYEANVLGYSTYSGEVNIPSTVVYNDEIYTVESIGVNAFLDDKVTKVIIPNSVTTIKGAAFSNCTLLKHVIMSNSVTTIGSNAFSNCYSIEEITIPNTVTSIGNNAFSNCSSLTEVVIPNSVTELGSQTFLGCTNIVKSAYPSAFSNPFSNTISICYPHDGIISLNGVIYNSDMSEIYYVPIQCEDFKLSEDVTFIASGAYAYCKNITEINIPDQMTTIGDFTFAGCTNLAHVSIPNAVSTIGEDAFWNCGSLKQIFLPNSVTSIKKGAFRWCINLEEINIPNSVVAIADQTFVSCHKLTKIVIPNSVTTIGASAFNDCTGLKDLNMSNSVQIIGNYAFHECESITGLIIPDSVTSIGTRAFYGCASITDVVVPNSVTEVGDYAFDQCKSLKKFAYPSRLSHLFIQRPICYEYIGGYSYSYSPIKINYPSDCIIDSNGFIYNSNKTKIYYAPYKYKTDNLVLSEPITAVCDGAFAYSIIDSITIPKSVTVIGSKAFYGSNIKKFIIQDAATSIGNYAFKGSSIEEIDLGNAITTIGVETFADKSINNITIPNSVTFIGENAFLRTHIGTLNFNAENAVYGGGSIRSISKLNIGEKVKCIPSCMFHGCNFDNEVIIPKSVMSIDEYAFCNSELQKVTIQDAPTSIGDYAFQGCRLEEIDLGNSVTTIGEYAFSDCASLAEMSIPNSVTTIGNVAFRGCTSLAEVSLPNSVITIGEYAFGGCTSLAEVSIPNSVTTIEDGTFSGCTSLAEVSIPNSVTAIGERAFSGCTSLADIYIPNLVSSINKCVFLDCTGLKSITIGPGVSFIESNAFKNTNIRKAFWQNEKPLSEGIGAKFNFVPNDSYKLSNQAVLKYIGDKFEVNELHYVPLSSSNNICMVVDFIDCQGDTILSIPDKVIHDGIEYEIIGINDAAFYGLSTLETITIPNKIRTIGKNAFLGCLGLKNLYSYAEEPPVCDFQTFDDATKWDCNLFVPTGSIHKYKSADQWKEFFSIEEFDHNSDINQVVSEKDNTIEVFNLSGLKVGTCFDGLAPGIYVVRSGGQTWKIRI